MDLLIIITLEVLSRKNIINNLIFPAPSTIILDSDLRTIFIEFMNTIGYIAIIILVSVLLNMLIVIIIYMLKIKYLENIVYRLNTVPRIIIMLIGISILGVGYKTILIVTCISSIPNFVITTLGYLKNENNKSIIEAANNCGISEFKMLLTILIPTNIRGIIISIKVLISQIINSVIIGEYLIGTKGIGSLLQYNLFMYNMKNVWMIILVICIFTMMINSLFNKILNSKKLWFNM